MNIEIILQAILALGTIIGGAVAAYATYRSTNSSVKVQEKQLGLEEARVRKELGSFGVEEAERISNISLANLQFMQQLVNECGMERAQLRTENNRLAVEKAQADVATLKLVNKIRNITTKHNQLREELTKDCPAFELVQNMLNELAVELEQGVIIQ